MILAGKPPWEDIGTQGNTIPGGNLRKRKPRSPNIKVEISPDSPMDEAEFEALCELFAEAILVHEKSLRFPKNAAHVEPAHDHNKTFPLD